MYDPRIGRFLEQDPIGFEAGDPNVYRYVQNNPTNASDPSGQYLVITASETHAWSSERDAVESWFGGFPDNVTFQWMTTNPNDRRMRVNLQENAITYLRNSSLNPYFKAALEAFATDRHRAYTIDEVRAEAIRREPRNIYAASPLVGRTSDGNRVIQLGGRQIVVNPRGGAEYPGLGWVWVLGHDNLHFRVGPTEIGWLQILAGVGEILVGIPAVPAYGIGLIPIAHGIDNCQAGVRTIRTGQPVRTATADTITWVAQQFGLSPETSHTVGDIGDLLIGLTGTVAAGLASSWRATVLAPTTPGATVRGLYGTTARTTLTTLADSGGPTLRVYSKLSQAPQGGRPLSVAVEQELALAVPNPSATQLYQGEIPRRLLEELRRIGLAEERRTLMGGVVGTEWRFFSNASEFIVRFFQRVGG